MADSRNYACDSQLSSKFYKEKYLKKQHKLLIDTVAFVHSQNHVGIQLADILSSVVLYIYTMGLCFDCSEHYFHRSYLILFKNPQIKILLKNLQFRYNKFVTLNGKKEIHWLGGISMNNPKTKQSAKHFFK